VTDAAGRWATALAAWALPPELQATAPRPPWGHEPERFRARAAQARGRRSPADRAARAALPRFGSLLDVACGAGAASVPLGNRGRQVTGVDTDPRMLEIFAETVQAPLRRVETIVGRWPDVEVGRADVVVCHDVAYDVPQLEAFVRGLTGHARRRVVLVVPQVHPMSWLTPYFEQLHGLSRPSRPTGDDALDVIRATGVDPTVERYRDPTRWGESGDRDELVASVRRRLCLDEADDPRIELALERVPPPTRREVLAVWWDLG
jgi:SAM-dependent methyltransferase